MSADDVIPEAVRAAFELGEAPAEPVSVGWINRTFVVPRASERVVVQRLHPIFRGEVNLDIDDVTRHLAAKGMLTPRLLRTSSGDAWVEHEGVWRALTFVPGRTVSALDPAHARAAGRIAGRFHRALADLTHTFRFTRPGAHDTRAHLAKLERIARSSPPSEDREIAEAILARGRALPDLSGLPIRIIHGDLKATNILFDDERAEARALVDLDTLQHGTLAVELGDALRSWCNPSDESDRAAVFDAERFTSALEGYAEGTAGLLEPAEIASIVPGAMTIAVELASRFAADVFEDSYFGYDAARFPSRVAHNRARAEAQLSLATSIDSQRDHLTAVVARVFA